MPEDLILESTPRPDDLTYMRVGRLLILLAEAPTQPYKKPLDADRLGTYDFFSDSPLLLFGPDSAERTQLLLAGFDANSLSYHSSSQRFVNRRARLQQDLAHLLARGLVLVDAEAGRATFALSDAGERVADQLITSYSDAYRMSAALITRTLNKLSNVRLRELTAKTLGSDQFLVDLGLGERVG